MVLGNFQAISMNSSYDFGILPMILVIIPGCRRQLRWRYQNFGYDFQIKVMISEFQRIFQDFSFDFGWNIGISMEISVMISVDISIIYRDFGGDFRGPFQVFGHDLEILAVISVAIWGLRWRFRNFDNFRENFEIFVRDFGILLTISEF